jgi:hypothetical protein
VKRILILTLFMAAVSSCKLPKPIAVAAPTDTARVIAPVLPEDPNAGMVQDTAIRGLVPEAPPISVEMHNYNKTITQLNLESDPADTGRPSQQQVFTDMLYDAYNRYTPDEGKIKALGAAYAGCQIRVVGGSWCDDTRMHVPRLLKVLDMSGFKSEDFSYSGVNRAKKPLNQNGPAAGMAIDRVPLIIVYRNGVEKGRIVETPRKSIENDLLDLLR